MRYLLPLALLLTITGCGAVSSHKISTSGGKTSASFKNVTVEKVCEVLAKSFGPLKGYSAEIPGDLKGKKITMEFSDVSTAEPVRKKLADATGYKVEIDAAGKKIKFTK